MSATGEFELIGRISAAVKVPQGTVGIGDDCAVIPQAEGLDTLVTTDLLVEDRHFLLDGIAAYDLGWKSAAVNISDIAAMGGRPESAFLSIALPSGLADREAGGERWMDAFIRGFGELCAKHGVALLGGDTSASPDKLFINVTVLGSCPHGSALQRSGASPGDLVCVTGPLGDSGAGLKLILEGAASDTDEKTLLSRHYRPEPRVAEGLALRQVPGVHAMMDISDGIASDLGHILDASGVGATVDTAALPLSPELQAVCQARGWDAVELAVGGGEDYELLLTVAPSSLSAATEALGGKLFPIGVITSEPGLRWEGGKTDYKGFTHSL